MAIDHISVRSFSWPDWQAIWQIRFAQLAEHGIHLESGEIPPFPQESVPGSYEWDIHHIESIYLSGDGGFWLAWQGNIPVGMVGAQDLGGVVELRRMIVRMEYRRRGIGRHLVKALIQHCQVKNVAAVELWTEAKGAGQSLYQTLGFHKVDQPGSEYQKLNRETGRFPNRDEIRMRLGLLSMGRDTDWAEQR